MSIAGAILGPKAAAVSPDLNYPCLGYGASRGGRAGKRGPETPADA